MTIPDGDARTRPAAPPTAPPTAPNVFQERVVEIRAEGEAAVIGTEARIVEEIVIRKVAADRVQTVRETVRRTEVDIEDSTTHR